MDGSDQAILAAAMAVAVGLVKVVEKLVDWLAKKSRNAKGEGVTVVSLDPETSRVVRETHELSENVARVIERTDYDGVPMVYTPRSIVGNQLKMAEAIRELSHAQDRVHESQEEIDRKLDEILSALRKS
jgi:hypothetical protein